MNAYSLDVQTALVTHSTSPSTFQGPVYLQNGCTGTTGSFQSVTTNTLSVGNTGTFADVATGSLKATSLSSVGIVASTSGYLATNGGGYNVFKDYLPLLRGRSWEREVYLHRLLGHW